MPAIPDVKKKRSIWLRIGCRRLCFLIVFLGGLVWVWSSYRSGYLSPELVARYRAQNPILTIYLFIGLYIVAVIAIIPSLPLNLAAGLFWGGLLGGLYSTIGVTIGGWVAFLISRYFLGDSFKQKLQTRWGQSIGRELSVSSWKILAFVRMNPVIPSGPLNYLLGLSTISSWEFLWTTFAFILPPSIAVAYAGATLETFVAEQASASDFLQGLLILSAAVTLIVAIRIFSNFIRKI